MQLVLETEFSESYHIKMSAEQVAEPIAEKIINGVADDEESCLRKKQASLPVDANEIKVIKEISDVSSKQDSNDMEQSKRDQDVKEPNQDIYLVSKNVVTSSESNENNHLINQINGTDYGATDKSHDMKSLSIKKEISYTKDINDMEVIKDQDNKIQNQVALVPKNVVTSNESNDNSGLIPNSINRTTTTTAEQHLREVKENRSDNDVAEMSCNQDINAIKETKEDQDVKKPTNESNSNLIVNQTTCVITERSTDMKQLNVAKENSLLKEMPDISCKQNNDYTENIEKDLCLKNLNPDNNILINQIDTNSGNKENSAKNNLDYLKSMETNKLNIDKHQITSTNVTKTNDSLNKLCDNVLQDVTDNLVQKMDAEQSENNVPMDITPNVSEKHDTDMNVSDLQAKNVNDNEFTTSDTEDFELNAIAENILETIDKDVEINVDTDINTSDVETGEENEAVKIVTDNTRNEKVTVILPDNNQTELLTKINKMDTNMEKEKKSKSNEENIQNKILIENVSDVNTEVNEIKSEATKTDVVKASGSLGASTVKIANNIIDLDHPIDSNQVKSKNPIISLQEITEDVYNLFEECTDDNEIMKTESNIVEKTKDANIVVNTYEKSNECEIMEVDNCDENDIVQITPDNVNSVEDDLESTTALKKSSENDESTPMDIDSCENHIISINSEINENIKGLEENIVANSENQNSKIECVNDTLNSTSNHSNSSDIPNNDKTEVISLSDSCKEIMESINHIVTPENISKTDKSDESDDCLGIEDRNHNISSPNNADALMTTDKDGLLKAQVDTKDNEVAEKQCKQSEKDSNKVFNVDSDDIAQNLPTSKIELANKLVLFSDDDEEIEKVSSSTEEPREKTCINVDDDDDIMLIDEDTGTANNDSPTTAVHKNDVDIADPHLISNDKINITDATEHNKEAVDVTKEPVIETQKDISLDSSQNDNKISGDKQENEKPLVSLNFIKSFKSTITEMTREDLEEFCLLKIVEGIVDRSNLSEIKSKLKTMMQNVEEWRKKAMVLTKQNRDLQIVLKTVQEEQKKRTDETITPLRITRSVGMQVLMLENKIYDKAPRPKKQTVVSQNKQKNKAKSTRSPFPQKSSVTSTVQIPVPRLVPAAASVSPNKLIRTTPPLAQTAMVSNSHIAMQKNSTQTGSIVGTTVVGTTVTGSLQSLTTKSAEKRPYNTIQSVVDLTDDEPPSKQQVTSKSSSGPVRLVPPQQLMPNVRPQSNSNQGNGPRKVFIPISGPPNNVRTPQTIMFKAVPTPPRHRAPTPMSIRQPNVNTPVRMPQRTNPNRHPAPLPEAIKQLQPPNWKALPPAPDLKISKVENGIVISWKIEGYQEDSYEEIASYQLYAYQETSSPPNTLLWKKIGDVKALPLPMACTLTQFMAGYKYYFAVRAIDIRSRIGPFSLPGSILLLNK